MKERDRRGEGGKEGRDEQERGEIEALEREGRRKADWIDRKEGNARERKRK